MLKEYPKKITLPDGAELILRPMTRDDLHALYDFFCHLVPDDRRFLRHDVTDRKVIEKWARHLDYSQVLPLLVEADGCIVANATLYYQTFGWVGQVAEVRIRIIPEFQGRKLGRALLGEISSLAARGKVKKLLARVNASQEGAIRAFERAGFQPLSVLKKFVKDTHTQQYADIALLVKDLP
jgi:L-amino acid N-acyltransferase YncA